MNEHRRATTINSIALALAVAATGLVAGDVSAQEQALPSDDRPSYPRANYTWSFATGPRYAAENPGAARVLPTPAGTVRLDRLQIPEELASVDRAAAGAVRHYVIQFRRQAGVESALRTIVAAAGGRALESPAAGFLLAALDARSREAVAGAGGVEVVEPYHPAFKLDPTIGRVSLPDPLAALSEVYTLNVGLWPGTHATDVAQTVVEIGGRVLRTYGDALVVELHRSLLARLAAIDAVRVVHEKLPLRPLAEETTTTLQIGRFDGGSTPYHDAGVDGRGLGLCSDLTTGCSVVTQATDCAGIGLAICSGPQVLMVLDSGFQLDAGDLSDTRTDAGEPGLAHRKVRAYQSTEAFGGNGDLSGCDAPPQDGFTHGHLVAATALGNATGVGAEYGGPGWLAYDVHGNPWKLDGLAPKAVLVAYDGQVTPLNGSCRDGSGADIDPGDLYNPVGSGACPGHGCPGPLGEAYDEHGARVVVLPWGADANIYGTESQDIDLFAYTKRDALVVVPAGNRSVDHIPAGGDGLPDPETLTSLATIKNGLVIGASRNGSSVDDRADFSSVGPAVNTTTNRVAPQLMAPGDDDDGLGLSSEFLSFERQRSARPGGL